MNHEELVKKYPKAMMTLAILVKSMEANPIKSLRAIADGKRKYSDKDYERYLAAAEKFIDNGMKGPVRTFSEVTKDN